MSGRISIPICTTAAALLASGIGADLHATTRASDCLATPNAASPRGQRWYYHIDLLNNRKCWYLHAPFVHGVAKASEFQATSTAADTPVSGSRPDRVPVSGSRADSLPRLHTQKLSAKPQPTSIVSTTSIRQSDAQWAPQQPQGSTPQVDGSIATVAASPSAAAKPIEQSDGASVTQQLQGSTLSKPTDAVAASSSAAAKPIEQSDAPSVAQAIEQSDAPSVTQQLQGSTLSKPTDAVAASSSAAAKPIEQSDAPSVAQAIEQSDAPSVTQQLQGSTLSNPTDAVAASSPATATLRVADANSAPPDADPEAFDDGGRKADIVRGLSFKPVQMFLFLVLGVSIVVFLVSLVIILHQRVTALMDLQLDRDWPKAQAGLQDDGARSSQMFVDDQRSQEGIDDPPWRARPSAARPQSGEATSTEVPPRSSLEEVKAALENFRADYVDRTQRFRGRDSPMAP